MNSKSKTNHSGFLIAIEGIDGSGKSTLSAKLYRDIISRGLSTFLTREPGNTDLGAKLRNILQSDVKPSCSKTEFLLFAADRAEHFSKIVIPKLANGAVVISDRMADSSLAYQGFGRGLDIEMIKTINQWAMESTQPDLVVYIDTPIELAQQRLVSSRKHLTNFELEEKMFWQRVQNGFNEIFKNRDDVIKVDGSLSHSVNSALILEKVLEMHKPLKEKNVAL